jgi:DNA invertase Pin-like site-specific DNA recombinase
MTQYVAYYRVSTQRQGQSGLGLIAQRQAVEMFMDANDELVDQFTEVESGRNNSRKELQWALKVCKQTGATLVIAKLDRLARNVHFISGLLESGVKFVAADMPEADRTFLQMSAVFAEWEARKISERTKSALQAAKARGTKLGSPTPKVGSEMGLKALKEKADSFASRVAPIVHDIVSKTGANNLKDIASALQARGVKTARGNDVWYPSQVSNLLKRVQA